MLLSGNIVKLSDVELDPVAKRIRDNIVSQVGEEKHSKAFPVYEWQRLSYAYSRINPGDKCLEVGPGRGYLTTMLSRGEKFSEVHAIDIVNRNLPKKVFFRTMSAAEIDYEDNYFDCVICMEVIEHLEDVDMYRAISEVRRVTRGNLIMSVPFCEPLPLPSYHKQSFYVERIKQLFPHASYSLLMKEPVMRVPWLLMEEVNPGTL